MRALFRNLWLRLRTDLRLQRPPVPFQLDADLAQSLQDLARREQRPEEEIAAELIASVLDQLHANDEYLTLWETLTPREKQVAAFTCLHFTNPQIAARLFISPHTVRAHVRSLLEKFGMHSKAELRQALSTWDFSDWLDTPP